MILPHAAALLGLPLFLPLLFLTGALSWFSYVVLGVEARYVGARCVPLSTTLLHALSETRRSWPSLASAVFPHRLKLHRLGEIFASCLVTFVSIARGTTSIVAASEILVDVLLPDGGQRWWERAACSGAIALVWVRYSSSLRRANLTVRTQVLLPTVVLPLIRSRRPSSPTPSSLSRTPPYLAFLLWPLALLILGVRLKALPPFSPSPPASPPSSRETMGLSIWGGVSILVFSLSAHQNTFKYLSSLARPPSTASRAVRSSSISRVASSAPKDGRTEGRRNQWPFAAALGVGGATIIQMGWGLVGYLGIEGGGREGNLFASPRLDRRDGWLLVVRLLVLVAIGAELEESLEPAYKRVRKGIRWGRKEGEAGRNGLFGRLGREEEKWDWRAMVARVGVWAGVVAVAVAVSSLGVEGEGLVSIAEVAGCVGSTLLAFLCPCAFFLRLDWCGADLPRMRSTLLHRPLPPPTPSIHLHLGPVRPRFCDGYSPHAQGARGPTKVVGEEDLAGRARVWRIAAVWDGGVDSGVHRDGDQAGLI